MTAEIHCEGAPRDLGLDQALACRSSLRARYAETPWWQHGLRQLGCGGGRAAVLARDLARHFPQQSEAIEGMARGAGIPYGWFAAVLERDLGADPPTAVVAGIAAVVAPPLTVGDGCLLARTIACEPIVRRSAPEGGFPSVELSLPWLTAALAGVNAGGLAAASVALPGAAAAGACPVPAALLVQDCLARFDSLEAAVDWCTGRPAGGRAVIALADATGAAALIEVDGDARRLVRPDAGLAVAGCALDADPLRRAAPLEAPTLAKILGARIAAIEPARRRITVVDAAASVACFQVEAPPAASEGEG